MSSHHETHPHQAPLARAHRPDTMAGYLALQREGDLARAVARSPQAVHEPTSTWPLLQLLPPAVGSRFRELLSRAAASRRPAPARRGQVQGDLACCA